MKKSTKVSELFDKKPVKKVNEETSYMVHKQKYANLQNAFAQLNKEIKALKPDDNATQELRSEFGTLRTKAIKLVKELEGIVDEFEQNFTTINFTTINDLKRHVADITADGQTPQDGFDAGVERLTKELWARGVRKSDDVSKKVNGMEFWDIFAG